MRKTACICEGSRKVYVNNELQWCYQCVAAPKGGTATTEEEPFSKAVDPGTMAEIEFEKLKNEVIRGTYNTPTTAALREEWGVAPIPRATQEFAYTANTTRMYQPPRPVAARFVPDPARIPTIVIDEEENTIPDPSYCPTCGDRRRVLREAITRAHRYFNYDIEEGTICVEEDFMDVDDSAYEFCCNRCDTTWPVPDALPVEYN